MPGVSNTPHRIETGVKVAKEYATGKSRPEVCKSLLISENVLGLSLMAARKHYKALTTNHLIAILIQEGKITTPKG